MFRVAIVGRPNVGKSTLFNRIIRSRKSLVGSEPGMTRDRISHRAEWDGKVFEVIDTGGIVPEEKGTLSELVFSQVEVALEEADLILFLVDARAGITPVDEEINALLRGKGREYLLVVNKVDVPAVEPEVYPFYRFGTSRLFPVSAEHAVGIGELLDSIAGRIPQSRAVAEEAEIRVAVIGRPNVGKSSLVNRLLGQQRVIVSHVPGTTRDSVDSVLRYKAETFRLIDTAGIRRKGKTDQMAEKLSVVKARKNLEQAEVVLLVIDAVEGVTKLDATIGGYAHEAGKSIIVVVNKWDLVEKDHVTSIQLEKEIRRRMRFLNYAPLSFVSAATGLRVAPLLEIVRKTHQARRMRIATAELNEFLSRSVGPALAGPDHSSRSPLKYACQVSSSPPTIVIFLRGSRPLHFSRIRFLNNAIRQRYGFFATPIRILQRPSRKKGEK